jgi:hypothetical protein
VTVTDLPWAITVGAFFIRLDGVVIDFIFNQSSSGNCPAALVGQPLRVTGPVNSGGSYNNVERALILSNAEGLVSHSALGVNQPVTARGTFRDTSQTLLVDN